MQGQGKRQGKGLGRYEGMGEEEEGLETFDKLAEKTQERKMHA